MAGRKGEAMFLLAVSGRHTTHYRNPQHTAAATDSLLPTSTIPRALFVYQSINQSIQKVLTHRDMDGTVQIMML